MQPFPKWALRTTMPSVFDYESVTAMEAVSKLYGVMSQLIDEYNDLTEALKEDVEDSGRYSKEEIENFKKHTERRISCKFNDLDAKMQEAKSELTKIAISWLEENSPGSLPVVTNADNGKMAIVSDGKWVPIVPKFTYDPETESLTINILGG